MTGGEGATWSTEGAQLIVHDEHGRAMSLTRLLGSGGQGDVWVVGNGSVAVKVLRAASQAEVTELHRRLRVVARLEIEDLPLSRPLAMLAPPHVGYTMGLLADMGALRTLSAAPPREDLLEWYTRLGGMRRRLRILGRAADALASLHARGLAYGDPSPSNILIPTRVDREHVWLIDVDNIAVESAVPDRAALTPGYGAPELVTGRSGVTSLSDAFAFAAIAFETLAIIHPFLGDMVHDGKAELEADAFAGKFPWIDHPEDDTNRSSWGLARDLVLSKRLRTLVELTFGAGLHDATARPTVAEWAAALHEAADVALQCDRCQASFYANRSACPWCGQAAPPAVVGRAFLHVPAIMAGTEHRERLDEALVVPLDEAVRVRGCTAALVGGEPAQPVAWLRWQRDGQLVVRNVGAESIWMVAQDGSAGVVALARGLEEQVPYGRAGWWDIHFGPRDEPHRFLTLSHLPRIAPA